MVTVSARLRFCLVALLFLFGNPRTTTAAALPSIESDFPKIEITVTRVARFNEDVELYAKSIIRMIPVRLTELDANDSNLTHVKGPILVRFREAGDPQRLSDNLTLELSQVLGAIARQQRPLSGGYFSIPNFEAILPNGPPVAVDHSPTRVTAHLDSIEYRKHHANNRRERDCRRTLVEVIEPPRSRR